MTHLQKINYKDDHCATRRIIFTYPMIAYTDMEDTVKAEVMEIATNACEKFLNDNQSVNNISWITISLNLNSFLLRQLI